MGLGARCAEVLYTFSVFRYVDALVVPFASSMVAGCWFRLAQSRVVVSRPIAAKSIWSYHDIAICIGDLERFYYLLYMQLFFRILRSALARETQTVAGVFVP